MPFASRWWRWKARPSDPSRGDHRHDHSRHPRLARRYRRSLLAAVHARHLRASLLHDRDRWAYDTGAGGLGAILVGLIASGTTFIVGQLLFAFVCPLWLKLLIVLAFVALAVVAGYHATHAIVQHTMPAET